MGYMGDMMISQGYHGGLSEGHQRVITGIYNKTVRTQR